MHGPVSHVAPVEFESLTYRMSQAFSEVLGHVNSAAMSQRGAWRSETTDRFSTLAEAESEAGGRGGQTVSLGISTRWKKEVWNIPVFTLKWRE